jgi:gamma-glutamyltranspeptidase / glutathione hydrolase
LLAHGYTAESGTGKTWAKNQAQFQGWNHIALRLSMTASRHSRATMGRILNIVGSCGRPLRVVAVKNELTLMHKIISMSAVLLLSLTSSAWPQATKGPASLRKPSVAVGSHGVVVSGKPAATAAGIKLLEQGGNAADAGAATLLALSVTYVGAFCVGGEVPILVYSADQKNVKLLEGQGEAPRDPKAIAWYMEHGIPDGDVKAAAVPGTMDAIVTLLKLYGTKSFEEVVQPTLAILDAGGPTWYIDTGSGERIETGMKWQADLAVTFRKLVESEKAAKGTREEKLQAVSDRFYRGDIADALEAWYIEKGGFLRKADLAAHKTPVVDPLTSTYRGYTVYKTGPLTQGPYLLQTLRLLEGFDLKKMGFNSADYIHTVIEAEKLALADRDEYYGDPNFVKVPMQELLSDRYTKMRRELIDPRKASLELRPGDPYNMKPTKAPTITGPWHGGTTVMCVMDKAGNVIAATPSGLSSTAGVAGRTGIIHGSRLNSLNTFKGTPNVIQPGKRPRITLSPTLLFHDNQPVMAISVAGGDQQDQAAIQVIVNYVDFGMNPEEAFSAPRFSTEHFISSFGQDRARLGSLSVPNTLPEPVRANLRARGHVVTTSRGGVGGVALIGIDPKTKQATAVGPAAAKIH